MTSTISVEGESTPGGSNWKSGNYTAAQGGCMTEFFGKCPAAAFMRQRRVLSCILARSSFSLQSFARRLPLWLGLEQLQLRLPHKIVVLQNADGLEQIGLLVVAVNLSSVDQIRQHGAEGNHRINALGTEQGNALF